MNHGRLPKRLVIDLDSLPAEVHGRQPGSEWNGYYRARVYHPLVASVGETGDLLDAKLRRGAAHTAEGGLGFIVGVLDLGLRGGRAVPGRILVARPAGRAGPVEEPVVVVTPSEAPLPRPAGRESGTRRGRLRLQRDAPASRRLRLTDLCTPSAPSSNARPAPGGA